MADASLTFSSRRGVFGDSVHCVLLRCMRWRRGLHGDRRSELCRSRPATSGEVYAPPPPRRWPRRLTDGRRRLRGRNRLFLGDHGSQRERRTMTNGWKASTDSTSTGRCPARVSHPDLCKTGEQRRPEDRVYPDGDDGIDNAFGQRAPRPHPARPPGRPRRPRSTSALVRARFHHDGRDGRSSGPARPSYNPRPRPASTAARTRRTTPKLGWQRQVACACRELLNDADGRSRVVQGHVPDKAYRGRRTHGSIGPGFTGRHCPAEPHHLGAPSSGLTISSRAHLDGARRRDHKIGGTNGTIAGVIAHGCSSSRRSRKRRRRVRADVSAEGATHRRHPRPDRAAPRTS